MIDRITALAYVIADLEQAVDLLKVELEARDARIAELELEAQRPPEAP